MSTHQMNFIITAALIEYFFSNKFLCELNIFLFQDYIFKQFKNEIYDLCLDLYGCRVIQCILIHGTVEHRSKICMEITRPPGLMNLIQHRYGNYVIQHALRM